MGIISFASLTACLVFVAVSTVDTTPNSMRLTHIDGAHHLQLQYADKRLNDDIMFFHFPFLQYGCKRTEMPETRFLSSRFHFSFLYFRSFEITATNHRVFCMCLGVQTYIGTLITACASDVIKSTDFPPRPRPIANPHSEILLS